MFFKIRGVIIFKNKFYKKSLLLIFCLILLVNIITNLLLIYTNLDNDLIALFYCILNLLIIFFPLEFVFVKDFNDIDFNKS
ncbi:MAG: hypothetical protein PHF21_04495 [Bacilli bacterium]|nr:hypothetical protein [Bacilli bacterium]